MRWRAGRHEARVQSSVERDQRGARTRSDVALRAGAGHRRDAHQLTLAGREARENLRGRVGVDNEHFGARLKRDLLVARRARLVRGGGARADPEEWHLEKARERFHWPKMHADVKQWCQRCAECYKRKSMKKNRAPLQPVETGFPFERVAMDIMGPLPKTGRGNKYILVVSDYFTKWPEAFPLPDQSATTVARVLINEIFSRFGMPYILHSDQGTNFDSTVIKEICIILEIKKTRTTAYHPQCDGAVERFNRTLQDLISLNVHNAKDNWDIRLGVVLMAYRSSVQTTTGFTPHYLMFGREMRIPVDIMFGPPPIESPTRLQTVTDLRDTLRYVYNEVRINVSEAQRRQKDYYDRLTTGERFKPLQRVWLFTPPTAKDQPAKFYKPWSGPWTVVSRLSDVNYRIQDSTTAKRKIVHFNRLKLYTAENVPPVPDEVIESDSDDEIVEVRSDRNTPPQIKLTPTSEQDKKSDNNSDPNTDNVNNNDGNRDALIEPKVSSASQPSTSRESRNEMRTANKVLPQQRAFDHSPITQGPQQAPSVQNEQLPNVTVRKNKSDRKDKQPTVHADATAKPQRDPTAVERFNLRPAVKPANRYGNWANAIFILAMMLALCGGVGAQDVRIFPKLGAVAEKCGNVAVDMGSTHFPMVLRLDLHEIGFYHRCLNDELRFALNESFDYEYSPSWLMQYSTGSFPTTSSDVNNGPQRSRNRRSPILAALGFALGGAAIFNMFSGGMSSREMNDIKEKQRQLYNHVQTLDTEITANHDDIVKVENLIGSLYEYTHHGFRELNKVLQNYECEDGATHKALILLNRRNRIRSKLYTDLTTAITAIYNHHATPILLPQRTIRTLIKQNQEFFNGTIYVNNEFLVYHYGLIYPLAPTVPNAIGYVLRLPRILLPAVTALYCLSSMGITVGDTVVRYKLPSHAVVVKGELRSLNVLSCTMFEADNYMCSVTLHTSLINCLSNSTSCLFEAKKYIKPEYNYNIYGYSIVSQQQCRIETTTGSTVLHTITAYYYVPFNTTGFVHCGSTLSLALEKREFLYHYDYIIEPQRVKHEVLMYAVDQWNDKSKLEHLREESNQRSFEKLKNWVDHNDSTISIVSFLLLLSCIFGVTVFAIYYFRCFRVATVLWSCVRSNFRQPQQQQRVTFVKAKATTSSTTTTQLLKVRQFNLFVLYLRHKILASSSKYVLLNTNR